ncbi:MAG: hypothetical protein AAF629_11525 [Chloroflexota bacterium]
MDYSEMINGAIQIARNGQTEQAKVMIMSIIAMTMNDVRQSLDKIDVRLDKQDNTLKEVVDTLRDANEKTH